MNCGRSSSVEWKLPKLQRRVRFPSPAPFSAWPRAGRFCYAPLRARVRVRIGYRHADRLISYPDAHNLSVKQQPIRAHRQGCNDDAGVKGADGQRQGQAGVLVGGGRAWQSYSQRPSPTGAKGTGGTGGPGCGARGRWRGLAGLRGDAPSEARGADGSRAGRRPRAQPAARPDSTPRGSPSGPPRVHATSSRTRYRREAEHSAQSRSHDLGDLDRV